MKRILYTIMVLTVVGLASGMGLVFVYRYAAPRIAENQQTETKEAIFKVFPKADSYEVSEGQNEVFLVKDKSGRKIGYVFTAKGNGYQGEIKLIAGIKNDLKTLTGIEILESQETPGLGQEITGMDFRKQFRGLVAEPLITYIKGREPGSKNQIQTITGATISSKAVVGILNARIDELRDGGL